VLLDEQAQIGQRVRGNVILVNAAHVGEDLLAVGEGSVVLPLVVVAVVFPALDNRKARLLLHPNLLGNLFVRVPHLLINGLRPMNHEHHHQLLLGEQGLLIRA